MIIDAVMMLGRETASGPRDTLVIVGGTGVATAAMGMEVTA
jgi:hypothetical protein